MNRPQMARLRSARLGGPEHPASMVSSGRVSAGRLRGAAEICLLARDPHLAARALWLLLKDQEPVRHERALGGHLDS